MSDDVGYGRVAALVPAAGRGERLGPGAPKAIREIAGTPMLVYAVKALAASPVVDVVVVAAHQITEKTWVHCFNPKSSPPRFSLWREENLDRNLWPGH